MKKNDYTDKRYEVESETTSSSTSTPSTSLEITEREINQDEKLYNPGKPRRTTIRAKIIHD